MAKGKREHRTFHVSVPLEDDEVLEWLSHQYNQSASMRELIRGAVTQVGMVDFFTGRKYNRPVGQSGRAKLPPMDTSASRKPRSSKRNADMISDAPKVVAAKSRSKSHKPKSSSGGIHMDMSVLTDFDSVEQTNMESATSANDMSGVDDIQAMLDE